MKRENLFYSRNILYLITIKFFFMRKLATVLCFTVLCIVTNAQNNRFRIYPVKKTTSVTIKDVALVPKATNTASISLWADSTLYEVVSVDSSFYFGGSAGIPLLTVSNNGDIEAITTPGVGYGFKWKPKGYDGNYMLGLDLFINASYNENDGYMSVSAMPVVWFLNYFGVGYGLEHQFYTDGNGANIWRFGMVVGYNF